jgi:hypothetical protein
MAQNRIFELRTHHSSPGKLDALSDRFRNHNLALFAELGIEVVGFWMIRDDDPATGRIICIYAHPDQETADRAWETFRADPRWEEARVSSEVDGKLVATLERSFMVPTEYSPIR